MANPGSAADDKRDLTAELLFGRLSANLCLFKRPVFNAEGLTGRERDVVLMDGELVGAGRGTSLRDLVALEPAAEGARTGHNANGVDVELARETGFGLVFAEGEHADAGQKNHGRTGVALFRRVGQGMPGVVLGVIGAVGFE